MVMAAEEFPASRRGMTIGVIQACSSLGAVFCAGIIPFLLRAPWGWRTVYFVGVIPLVILMYARRDLKETKRFTERRGQKPPALFAIWKTPYAKRVLMLAAIWFFAYIPAQNAISFWKEFAVNERGFTDAEVATAMTIAAVVSMPFIFATGHLLDRVGRRRGAVIVFVVSAIGVYTCYTLESKSALTAALILGMFGASAYLPILNAYSSELFPTRIPRYCSGVGQ